VRSLVGVLIKCLYEMHGATIKIILYLFTVRYYTIIWKSSFCNNFVEFDIFIV